MRAHSFRILPHGLLMFMLALMGAVAVSAAYAAEPSCETCESEESKFPDAAEFLASKGYPAAEYAALMAWTESTPAAEKTLVSGYRVQPLSGDAPFDLYYDESGNLLEEKELRTIGIKKKKWNLAPIERQAEVPSSLAKALPVRPVAVGAAKGLVPKETIPLAPIDATQVAYEDAEGLSTPNKSVRRIGVFQEIPGPLNVNGSQASHGAWTQLADGSALWSVLVNSPEAVGQRIEFSTLSLPEGAQVVVYNADFPDEAYGPYTAIPADDESLWSATCFADTVAIECHVPAGTAVDAVKITIKRIVHIYADFADLQWGSAQKAAGSCNLDVASYPAWEETSWGVAGIGTIGSSGSLWCTGSLIVDNVPDTDIPYFLTANHCVGGQTSASSLEFYWLYQRDPDTWVVPSVLTVPRTTGGADFLAGTDVTTGTDFNLLRLRNTPPDGLTFLGWSTVGATVGTSTTCIHHPRGDYKRISFGAITDAGGPSTDYERFPGRPIERFHENLWSDGTTEGGSSGSPLMLRDTHQIIGQLWGGYAGCFNTDDPDYYGRFDVSYPLIEAWLGGSLSPQDIDGNGVVNVVDVQLAVNGALEIPIIYDADVNDDGDINVIDVQLVIIAALAD